MKSTYNLARSYQWNYAHGPQLSGRAPRVPRGAGGRLLGHRVRSRLGVSAGPLLNARWIRAYARLGYDILTYKTVRTRYRSCFPMPNVVIADAPRQLAGGDVKEPVAAAVRPHAPRVESRRGGMATTQVPTIAISFGMPSMEPDVWRRDVRRAREALGPGQILVVGTVGTVGESRDPNALAEDFAACAGMAAEAGAHVVEVHLACPNTSDEHPCMIYEDHDLAEHIVESVRRRIKGHPAIAKLGFEARPEVFRDLVRRLARHMDGVLLVNGLQRPTIRPDGTPAFPGAHRRLAGISGDGTREASLATVREALAIRKALGLDIEVWAVGGLSTPADVVGALAMGADTALVATAAMFDPLLAVRTHAALA